MKHYFKIGLIILSGLSFFQSTGQSTSGLSDEALLDTVQKQTIKYFWDFAHPVSGLARERSNATFGYGNETCTSGGTGFGVMAIIAGVDRNWIARDSAAFRLLKMVDFLKDTPSFHGVFPHWINGETGATIPFSKKDDGADLVETAFLFQGLLCARAYFNGDNETENALREQITGLWGGVDFNHHSKGTDSLLYWHWSPNYGFEMNFELRGWNETLITYILAAASPNYNIDKKVYDSCWTKSSHFENGKDYFGIKLPLGFEYGGPLFFAHYSFLGLNPKGLKDKHADYWQQNVSQTQINYKYCVENPLKYKGYSPQCWGLTASDNHKGYSAHSPTNDLGVITPTAALSSFPYSPKESMAALRYFFEEKGKELWGDYGFKDAMNETENWYSDGYLAIDQGPIVVMIENYRSGLFWDLFMQIPEIQNGLTKLGFESPYLLKK